MVIWNLHFSSRKFWLPLKTRQVQIQIKLKITPFGWQSGFGSNVLTKMKSKETKSIFPSFNDHPNSFFLNSGCLAKSIGNV